MFFGVITKMQYKNTSNSNICYFDFSQKSTQILQSESNIESQINNLKPSIPVYALRPDHIQKSALWFLNNFHGRILYSVKSNPDKSALKYLYQAGIKEFDVASLNEVKLIADLFDDAKMYFMHPIKSFEAIQSAYFDFGIRHFSLDSFDELEKILAATNNAKDLGLHIRLAIANPHSAIDLSGKFGILPSDAISLIIKSRIIAKTLGICFHVGSQCMEPAEYRHAITTSKEVIEQAKVKLDVLDIGGGFPASYPSLTPPALQNYIDEINDSIKSLSFDDCQLWCEPGRALVAESGSLIVKVEARKNQMLYINDGIYGGLFDAGQPGFIYPTKTIRINNSKLSNNMIAFGFYGPTCDGLDVMKGPFYLPEDIKAGDYIEIGNLGAYCQSIRSGFNGFDEVLQIEVKDQPLISIYEDEEKFANQNKQ